MVLPQLRLQALTTQVVLSALLVPRLMLVPMMLLVPKVSNIPTVPLLELLLLQALHAKGLSKACGFAVPVATQIPRLTSSSAASLLTRVQTETSISIWTGAPASEAKGRKEDVRDPCTVVSCWADSSGRCPAIAKYSPNPCTAVCCWAGSSGRCPASAKCCPNPCTAVSCMSGNSGRCPSPQPLEKLAAGHGRSRVQAAPLLVEPQ
mmetsp:Transcript_34533/g.64462  ORF Transcript_34533/g.64462 Transcript_34533/m.64462 type:complete len:206 (+) Transcript_34533:166-783(+)